MTKSATPSEQGLMTTAVSVPEVSAGLAGNDIAGGRNHHRALFDQFAAAIDAGSMRAGERMPSERQLMEGFAATRNTVRKALDALERDGLVVRRRGSGTYVSQNKNNRAATGLEASKIGPLDVLETRLILEPGFVDLIISRATPDDFDRMEEWLDRADRSKSQDEFREAALAFRMEAARATRNPLIIQIYEFIMDSRKDAGWHRLRKVDDSKDSQRLRTQRSRAFLAALRDRNKTLARQLIKMRLSLMVAEVTGAGSLDDEGAASAVDAAVE
jgi:DNA-binding FadR family transcriptional regulator